MKSITYIIGVLLLMGCEKEPFPSKLFSIDNVNCSEIEYTTAIIQFLITGSYYKAGIIYGTEQGLSNSKMLYTEKENGDISIKLKDLKQGTAYFYKAFIEDKSGNKIYSEIKSFLTKDIDVSISSIEADLEGGVFEFNLNTKNMNWTISTTQYWTSVSPNSVKNMSSVKVYIDPFVIPFERYDTIVIKNINSNLTKTIPIIQKSSETISNKLHLSIPAESFGQEGGNSFFVVSSNSSWTASSNKDWCKIITTSGINEQLLFYTVDPTTSTNEQRFAIITIRANDGVRYFAVGQQSYQNDLHISGGIISIYNSIPCGVFDFIEASSSWAISSSTDWCFYNKISGIGNKESIMTIRENTTFKDRVSTQILKSGNSTFKKYIIQRGLKENINKTVPNIEMIFVQGGTFMMGYNIDEESKPIHKVTLSDFYISKYEVTQKLWEAVMGNNPSYCLGDNLPVNGISWSDATEFITKLNSLTGKKYRLPTEAEWEYAAKGGQKSMGYKYSGSNSIEDVCNLPGIMAIAYVGSKKPNELGIYDMTGNVSEYCSDWYGPYSSISEINPMGPTSGEYKVVRGEYYSTSNTYRSWTSINGYTSNNGFRLVLDKE